MNNIDSSTGEIVMYQPDKTIGKHVNNALHEELANVPTVANFAIVHLHKNARDASSGIAEQY